MARTKYALFVQVKKILDAVRAGNVIVLDSHPGLAARGQLAVVCRPPIHAVLLVAMVAVHPANVDVDLVVMRRRIPAPKNRRAAS